MSDLKENLALGMKWELEAHESLEHLLSIKMIHNLVNSPKPDLEHFGIGIECKHRSGRYPTTTDHVRNQIMPKFFQGFFICKRNKQIFIPALDNNRNPIAKPEYWIKFVLMSKIAPPTKAATKLLNQLKIRIVTLYELSNWFMARLKPKESAKKSIAPAYSFLLMLLLLVFNLSILLCSASNCICANCNHFSHINSRSTSATMIAGEAVKGGD